MTSNDRAMGGYVLGPGAGRRIVAPGIRSAVTMKAEARHTGGRVTVFESVQEPRSVGPARHVHDRLVEIFYVLEGTVTFLVGQEVHRATPGTSVVIVPGVVHAFRNAEDEPARLLITVLPGGFEGFFDDSRDLGTPMDDAARWDEINTRYNIHVVGPPLGAAI